MRAFRRRLAATALPLILGLIAGCPAQSGDFELLVGADGTGGRAAPASGSGGVQGASSVGLLAADTTESTQQANDLSGCNEPITADAFRARIFELVNQERVNLGLTQVTPNDTLAAQADGYACEMISGNFFAHVNPETSSTLRDRAAQYGYKFQVIGENLAAGQTTPERVFLDWMESPTHRQNIVDPRFTELGVAVRIGGYYGIYWVQEFGLPAAEK